MARMELLHILVIMGIGGLETKILASRLQDQMVPMEQMGKMEPMEYQLFRLKKLVQTVILTPTLLLLVMEKHLVLMLQTELMVPMELTDKTAKTVKHHILEAMATGGLETKILVLKLPGLMVPMVKTELTVYPLYQLNS